MSKNVEIFAAQTRIFCDRIDLGGKLVMVKYCSIVGGCFEFL